MTLTFGNVPVPWTVAWSGEAAFRIGFCPVARMDAICQTEAPGIGKPTFGKPHSQRQRKAIGEGLCDVCGKPLRNRTKVSLSHARLRTNGARGACIMQVEPLLHRECAALSVRSCPSLKRDIRTDSLIVRQVSRYRVQFALMALPYIRHYVPDYSERPGDRIVGHAKVELLVWTDRDANWLGAAG